ncbi:MAG: hypothetical protein ACLFN8_00180 [Candidatus Woesearchaeota archaeon]
MEIIERQNKILFEGFSVFSLLLLLAIIVMTAFSTNSSLIFVVVGFLPALITVILSLVLYEESFHHKLTLWFIPLIIAASFFFIGTNYTYMNNNMDVATLTSINIIFSLLYLVIFFLLVKISKPKKKKLNQKPINEEKQEPKIIIKEPEVDIQEYIASIEEKSKALNFAIGRTYNKYHGGSIELRQQINLKAEWYNELSEALQNEKSADKIRVFMIVENIEKQLNKIKQPEKEVFTQTQLEKLKNLDRDENGNNIILDVLMKNDADPVELYYKGMEEFCETIRRELEEKTKEKMKGEK